MLKRQVINRRSSGFKTRKQVVKQEPMGFFDQAMLRSYTKKQKAHLQLCYDECKKLGATSKQLAPLGALLWVSFKPLTKKQWAIGLKLARKYNWPVGK